MSDYKNTLNLPDTKFPMKANLTQKEPEMLKFWENVNAYQAMINSGSQKGTYVLHDGPPYANGHIHLGTALNKILKDIIVKSRNMQGYFAEYVPGWDCHGLPIELKEKKKSLPANVVRKLCREYAAKWIDVQRKQFKRLGVFGTWEKPYRSMDPSYEAATARELGNFMANGSVLRSKKPIHWCCSCKTALAEAEVEYYDHVSHSIYVRFPVIDERLSSFLPKAEKGKTYVVIWTTTPWTIPDNLAIALHPELEYALVKAGGNFYVLASELVESSAKTFGWEDFEILERVLGAKLEGMVAKHPLYERNAPIVLGEHVTLEAGTGCVHTAPGHGREDYEMGLKYGLDILSPMDDEGRFLESVEFFAGKTIFEANPLVIEKLEASSHLLAKGKVKHSYPHCWRCKEPVIFRATTQWFIGMEKNDLRNKALKAIRNDVRWIPAWGEERIYSMIENRPDWCISRQRTWGVPIVALLCQGCGEAWHDAKWNKDMAERFEKHPTGCDYWFDVALEDIVPQGLTCPHCKSPKWEKETDILDVWFDSGTSFAAVLEQREECRFPADLYLEGSDQHRGWFHSSLLASVGTRNTPSYKAVLTHGYVVDGEGKKMSKSVGNVVAPEEVITKFGAEVLRMWVASVDYREDIRISDEILNRQVDAYRRIRNTCRYLLGNLGGFSAAKALPDHLLNPLDAYAVDVVTRAHEEVQKAYSDYEFHRVFHTLHNLCVTDLSSFYLDVLKDRLYASAPESAERLSAQTALWRILLILVADMAPILSFTAEEVFSYLSPELRPDKSTVFALNANTLPVLQLSAEQRKNWETILEVRANITKSIEPLRKAGDIGHALDTAVIVYAGKELKEVFASVNSDLRAIFLVSQLNVEDLANAPEQSTRFEEMPELAVTVKKAAGEKCARCWIYSTELGTNPAHPEACPRCTKVLESMGA